ncbi:MAG: GMC family oxidoreductase [Myxococcota bacterium]
MIGSGAGGGTFAGELAARGWRVLLVERGRSIVDPAVLQDERAMLERRVASEDPPPSINGRPMRPVVGSLPGGSTALFGAVMMRPAPADFAPGQSYGSRLPDWLARWPIDYAELEPYLERAEDLYGVAGDAHASAPHLGRRRIPYKSALPDLEPVNTRIAGGLVRTGLRPFRLPLAIDFDRCRRCPGCPGLLCPHEARASSWNRAVAPRRNAGLEVWEDCEATRIEFTGRRVRAVRLAMRASGERRRVTAGLFAVSAGAIGSPALLLRSEVPDASDQLGRNHMCHLGVLAVAAFGRSTGARHRLVKQLGWSDHYLGAPDLPAKLGVVQQIPIPGPRSIGRQLGVPLPTAMTDALRDRLLLFAGTLEDLPAPENRVGLDAFGNVRLTRRFRAYDLERGRRWARLLGRTLRRAGVAGAFTHVAGRAHDHLAHQVGTCRFGNDPRYAVLDRDCRIHGFDNLHVVDGSFLPTSLGVGPALTIAANALRVAERVDGGRSDHA